MTGEGSDEILAGYPHFRRDAVLYGSKDIDAATRQQLLAQLEQANRVSSGLLMPQPGTQIESVRRAMGFVPSQLETWSQIGTGLLAVTSDEFRCAYAERDTYRLLMNTLDVERQIAGRDVVNQSLYVWAKTMLPNYILSNLGDRMEMAHSVEGRLPFLDHHVVEAVAQMPVSMKINGMTEKWVLREAARPVITDTVYRRQKHPFMSPPSTVQQDGKLFTMLQDTLRSSLLDGPGIYDRAKVVGMLDAIPGMDVPARNAERQLVDVDGEHLFAARTVGRCKDRETRKRETGNGKRDNGKRETGNGKRETPGMLISVSEASRGFRITASRPPPAASRPFPVSRFPSLLPLYQTEVARGHELLPE